MQNCHDWEMVWDEDKSPAMFPPVIVVTAKRPDVTIYSSTEKKCVVIELTVPAEKNFAQANSRKSASMLISYTSARKQAGKWNTSLLKLGPEGSPTKLFEAVSNTWTYPIKRGNRWYLKNSLKNHLHNLVGKK